MRGAENLLDALRRGGVPWGEAASIKFTTLTAEVPEDCALGLALPLRLAALAAAAWSSSELSP